MLIRKGGASPRFKNFIWTEADGPEISCGCRGCTCIISCGRVLFSVCFTIHSQAGKVYLI